MPKAREVVPGREARERGEQHGRDRDREHPLREHVDEERLLDRGRGEVRVDVARREEHVDHRVDVDQSEPERDRHHQHEDAFDRRVAPVEDELQPAVAAAQPGHGEKHLDNGRQQDRGRVDVQLRAHRVRLRDADG